MILVIDAQTAVDRSLPKLARILRHNDPRVNAVSLSCDPTADIARVTCTLRGFRGRSDRVLVKVDLTETLYRRKHDASCKLYEDASGCVWYAPRKPHARYRLALRIRTTNR